MEAAVGLGEAADPQPAGKPRKSSRDGRRVELWRGSPADSARGGWIVTASEYSARGLSGKDLIY
jgi:hypothetical protein